jgi:hypothetical protein
MSELVVALQQHEWPWAFTVHLNRQVTKKLVDRCLAIDGVEPPIQSWGNDGNPCRYQFSFGVGRAFRVGDVEAEVDRTICEFFAEEQTTEPSLHSTNQSEQQ